MQNNLEKQGKCHMFQVSIIALSQVFVFCYLTTVTQTLKIFLPAGKKSKTRGIVVQYYAVQRKKHYIYEATEPTQASYFIFKRFFLISQRNKNLWF